MRNISLSVIRFLFSYIQQGVPSTHKAIGETWKSRVGVCEFRALDVAETLPFLEV
ncbi:MAG: hypothetical protein Q9N02_04875 [Ghiorsea sp.]|nr:hypothetical protein [Ghiorsea sp.]